MDIEQPPPKTPREEALEAAELVLDTVVRGREEVQQVDTYQVVDPVC